MGKQNSNAETWSVGGRLTASGWLSAADAAQSAITMMLLGNRDRRWVAFGNLDKNTQPLVRYQEFPKILNMIDDGVPKT